MRLALLVAGVLLASPALGQEHQLVTVPHSVPPLFAPLQPPFPSTSETQQPPQNKTGTTNHPSASEQRGTEDHPVVVKVLPAEKTAEERAQEQQARGDQSSTDFWLVSLTGALAFVGILQFAALIGQAIVFRVQANALRESVDLTRKVAGRQEIDMRASITEAARAAGAMEDVAAAMTQSVANTRAVLERQREFAVMQMRAYISLIDPGFIPQVRETPYFLEIQLNIVNTGHTPAHHLRFGARLRILPFPLPDGFDFVIPENEFIVSGHVNPGQRLFFRRNIGRLLTDDELNNIMREFTQRLFIYGTVIFDDAFGVERRTNFCQFGIWDTQYKFSTMNINRHNDAT